MTVNMATTYIFRSEMAPLEKRQLFLRSYQFSRKQSMAERINKSFFRVRKSISLRFRSVRKLRKVLWFKLKNGLFFTTRRRRFFLRLHNSNYSSNYNYNYNYSYAFFPPTILVSLPTN
ncbi:hypothetical protein C2S51_011014 [Perilla frutescens var. frutescens]|nr:hypothetical protein C2S51_011014 [Perilla frutescens var. frutescens]